MDFELQWLLLGLPLAFALGWLASRIDLRQWKREQRESSQTYLKGLNLLLNEQQDKAIDTFIEVVQNDPDSTELHFSLGNLFRRRGEYERAVRLHEFLLARAGLPRAERERAQAALAQDFMKAGLFDRAEQAYRALEGTRFDTDARLALLALHERSRDWRTAIDVARKLEQSGAASFASRIAHYWCEIAHDADARGQPDAALEALAQAREVDPQAPRPLVMLGRRHARDGAHAQAMQTFGELLVANRASFNLVALEFAASARACGRDAAALEQLDSVYRTEPSLDLLSAIGQLDSDARRQRERLTLHLAAHPALSAAQQLLCLGTGQGAAPLVGPEVQAIVAALEQGARPLQRYRCAACGFEGQHHFWQCPGCMAWDSYPPLRLEES